jgi:hypothetical protein
MADVSGKFFSAKKVRTGVSPSSPGVIVGETLPPVNPPGGGLNSVGLTMPAAFAVANSPLTSNGTIEVTGAGTTAEYVRGDGSLATFPALTGFVPYTGATADVDLGTHDLTAERGTFENNGSSDTLTVNHTSGSGKGINVTKGGNGEALLVTKTSGSGNAMAVVGGRTALVDLSLSSVSNATGNFLTISGGVVHQRTPSETRSDVGAQAQLNGTGFVKASGTTITYDNSTYQVTSEKAQPNGYASLDSNGKVPLVQINDALIGNVNFQGLWNAATNTPTLANPPASGTKGYYYIVSTAGTFAGISFEVGDWIISNGTAWGKVDNTDAVSSVFGRTGNVTATNGDYNTSQVTENTNLYYTEARVNANANVAANTAARHNAVTLGTANGLSLSTQQLSLGLASAGVTGALSGTDWSTFNSKQQALNGTGFVKISGTTISYDNSTYLTTAAAASTYLALAGGTMTGAINIVKDNDVLNITPVTSGGYSVVNFNSRVNLDSDKGFIVVQDESAFCEGSGNEDLRMSIGVFNDFRQSSTHSDELWLQGGGRLVYNVGSWDSELNTIIGTPGVGTTGGYEWRVNNSVVASLNPSGNLTAASIIRSGGTSSQFLKADGSIDSNAYITGNQTITLSGDATGSGTTAITVVLANSGVAAGTYNNSATQVRPFTVDAKGRVTSIGTAVTITPAFSDVTGKPTTLSGYGITDAYTQTQVNTLLSGYLPLTGGTLTGALVGTSASFSGNLTVSTGNATGGGIILADDGDIVDLNDAFLSLRFSSGVRVFSANRGGSPVITLANTGAISANGNITGANLSGINTGDQTLSGLGGVPTSRTITINGNTQDLSDNRIYNVGTVTSVAALTLGTSGTDLSSSVANGTTTPVITLNVPTASAANRGALSAADWTTFNNKQNALTNPVTGTGTTNYLPKFTGTSTIGNSNFQENSGSLGINGAATPDGGDTRVQINATTYSSLSLKSTSINAIIRAHNPNGILYVGTISNHPVSFVTNDSEKMVLSTSGNLGLGVTPSAWASGYKAFQFGNSSTETSAFFSNGVNDFWAVSNAYFDGTNFKRVATGTATGYEQFNGAHKWYQVASDSAGTNVSFTQAMTLGSNSGLSIGTPSAAPSQGLLVQGQSIFSGNVKYNGASATSIFNIWSVGAVDYGYNGISGSSNSVITGSVLGDMVLRTTNKSILFSTNDGSTSALSIAASSGAATFSSSVTAARMVLANGDNLSWGGLYGSGIPTIVGFNSELYFYPAGSSLGDTMRIFNNGNVFIGTSPSNAGFKLDVNGTGRFSGALTANLLTSGSNVALPSNYELSYGNGNVSILGNTTTNTLEFRTSNATKVTIASTGAATFSSSVTATSIIRSGGTSSQYLMADGSVSTLTNPVTGTGSGTTNTIPKFTGANALGNSIITDSGSLVSIDGNFRIINSNGFNDSVNFDRTAINGLILNSSGNLILNGSTGSSRITCYGDGFFSGGIQTGNPYGTTAANWLLGRFLTETTSANGSIRVQIGSKYYNIAAEDLGTVPT